MPTIDLTWGRKPLLVGAFCSHSAPTRPSGDDLDALVIFRHKPVLEDILKPPNSLSDISRPTDVVVRLTSGFWN